MLNMARAAVCTRHVGFIRNAMMAISLRGVGNRLETLTPVTEKELTGFWDRLVITKVEDTQFSTVAGSEDNASSISREAFDAMVRTKNKDTRDIANIKVSHEIGGADDKRIATRIVTKEVYQNVFQSQQQKALRDTSALARASLKQVPDKSDRRIAYNRLEECLKRCPHDALGSDKTAYAECLNTQALFYLSGMPLCDSKTAIERATALFGQVASLGDDAAGSAHYHLAKGFFFSALSLKDLGKRKRAVDACKLHISKVLAVVGSPYRPACCFYEKCLQISDDFSKPIEYEDLCKWCSYRGADYRYYYANLLSKAPPASNWEARRLLEKSKKELKYLAAMPDKKFSSPYRQCKARARLGILYYKQGNFTEAIDYLVAGLQSSIAQVWRCLYGIALLGGKGEKIAAAIGTIYPKAENISGLSPVKCFPLRGDADERLLEVLSEAHRTTQSAIPQEKASLESLRRVEWSMIVGRMKDIESKLRTREFLEHKESLNRFPGKIKVAQGLDTLLYLLGEHRRLISVNVFPPLPEIHKFIDGYTTLILEFNEGSVLNMIEEVPKEDMRDVYYNMLRMAKENMGFLEESVVFMSDFMNMQSTYQEAAICRFESLMGKRNFAKGGFGEVKQGFVFEDSSKRHFAMNDGYSFEESGQPNPGIVGIPVVAKSANTDDEETFIQAQAALECEKSLLEILLSDHPNISQVLPGEGRKDVMVMRHAGFKVFDFIDALSKEEKKCGDVRRAYELRIAKIDHIVRILAQLLNAVQYTHEKGYVHADIKLENLMIDASGRVRLIDFGCALMLGEGIRNSEVVITEPFPCEGKIEMGPDIWAIGQALLQMLAMDEFLVPRGAVQTILRACGP